MPDTYVPRDAAMKRLFNANLQPLADAAQPLPHRVPRGRSPSPSPAPSSVKYANATPPPAQDDPKEVLDPTLMARVISTVESECLRQGAMASQREQISDTAHRVTSLFASLQDEIDQAIQPPEAEARLQRSMATRIDMIAGLHGRMLEAMGRDPDDPLDTPKAAPLEAPRDGAVDRLREIEEDRQLVEDFVKHSGVFLTESATGAGAVTGAVGAAQHHPEVESLQRLLAEREEQLEAVKQRLEELEVAREVVDARNARARGYAVPNMDPLDEDEPPPNMRSRARTSSCFNFSVGDTASPRLLPEQDKDNLPLPFFLDDQMGPVHADRPLTFVVCRVKGPNLPQLWRKDGGVMYESYVKAHTAALHLSGENRGWVMESSVINGCVVAFESAVDALTFAKDVHERLMDINWSNTLMKYAQYKNISEPKPSGAPGRVWRGLRMAIGIHTCPPRVPHNGTNPISGRTDFASYEVLCAQQLVDLAAGGETLLSQHARDSIDAANAEIRDRTHLSSEVTLTHVEELAAGKRLAEDPDAQDGPGSPASHAYTVVRLVPRSLSMRVKHMPPLRYSDRDRSRNTPAASSSAPPSPRVLDRAAKAFRSTSRTNLRRRVGGSTAGATLRRVESNSGMVSPIAAHGELPEGIEDLPAFLDLGASARAGTTKTVCVVIVALPGLDTLMRDEGMATATEFWESLVQSVRASARSDDHGGAVFECTREGIAIAFPRTASAVRWAAAQQSLVWDKPRTAASMRALSRRASDESQTTDAGASLRGGDGVNYASEAFGNTAVWGNRPAHLPQMGIHTCPLEDLEFRRMASGFYSIAGTGRGVADAVMCVARPGEALMTQNSYNDLPADVKNDKLLSMALVTKGSPNLYSAYGVEFRRRGIALGAVGSGGKWMERARELISQVRGSSTMQRTRSVLFVSKPGKTEEEVAAEAAAAAAAAADAEEREREREAQEKARKLAEDKKVRETLYKLRLAKEEEEKKKAKNQDGAAGHALNIEQRSIAHLPAAAKPKSALQAALAKPPTRTFAVQTTDLMEEGPLCDKRTATKLMPEFDIETVCSGIALKPLLIGTARMVSEDRDAMRETLLGCLREYKAMLVERFKEYRKEAHGLRVRLMKSRLQVREFRAEKKHAEEAEEERIRREGLPTVTAVDVEHTRLDGDAQAADPVFTAHLAQQNTAAAARHWEQAMGTLRGGVSARQKLALADAFAAAVQQTAAAIKGLVAQGDPPASSAPHTPSPASACALAPAGSTSTLASTPGGGQSFASLARTVAALQRMKGKLLSDAEEEELRARSLAVFAPDGVVRSTAVPSAVDASLVGGHPSVILPRASPQPSRCPSPVPGERGGDWEHRTAAHWVSAAIERNKARQERADADAADSPSALTYRASPPQSFTPRAPPVDTPVASPTLPALDPHGHAVQNTSSAPPAVSPPTATIDVRADSLASIAVGERYGYKDGVVVVRMRHVRDGTVDVTWEGKHAVFEVGAGELYKLGAVYSLASTPALPAPLEPVDEVASPQRALKRQLFSGLSGGARGSGSAGSSGGDDGGSEKAPAGWAAGATPLVPGQRYIHRGGVVRLLGIAIGGGTPRATYARVVAEVPPPDANVPRCAIPPPHETVVDAADLTNILPLASVDAEYSRGVVPGGGETLGITAYVRPTQQPHQQPRSPSPKRHQPAPRRRLKGSVSPAGGGVVGGDAEGGGETGEAPATPAAARAEGGGKGGGAAIEVLPDAGRAAAASPASSTSPARSTAPRPLSSSVVVPDATPTGSDLGGSAAPATPAVWSLDAAPELRDAGLGVYKGILVTIGPEEPRKPSDDSGSGSSHDSPTAPRPKAKRRVRVTPAACPRRSMWVAVGDVAPADGGAGEAPEAAPGVGERWLHLERVVEVVEQPLPDKVAATPLSGRKSRQVYMTPTQRALAAKKEREAAAEVPRVDPGEGRVYVRPLGGMRDEWDPSDSAVVTDLRAIAVRPKKKLFAVPSGKRAPASAQDEAADPPRALEESTASESPRPPRTNTYVYEGLVVTCAGEAEGLEGERLSVVVMNATGVRGVVETALLRPIAVESKPLTDLSAVVEGGVYVCHDRIVRLKEILPVPADVTSAIKASKRMVRVASPNLLEFITPLHTLRALTCFPVGSETKADAAFAALRTSRYEVSPLIEGACVRHVTSLLTATQVRCVPCRRRGGGGTVYLRAVQLGARLAECLSGPHAAEHPPTTLPLDDLEQIVEPGVDVYCAGVPATVANVVGSTAELRFPGFWDTLKVDAARVADFAGNFFAAAWEWQSTSQRMFVPWCVGGARDGAADAPKLPTGPLLYKGRLVDKVEPCPSGEPERFRVTVAGKVVAGVKREQLKASSAALKTPQGSPHVRGASPPASAAAADATGSEADCGDDGTDTNEADAPRQRGRGTIVVAEGGEHESALGRWLYFEGIAVDRVVMIDAATVDVVLRLQGEGGVVQNVTYAQLEDTPGRYRRRQRHAAAPPAGRQMSHTPRRERGDARGVNPAVGEGPIVWNAKRLNEQLRDHQDRGRDPKQPPAATARPAPTRKQSAAPTRPAPHLPLLPQGRTAHTAYGDTVDYATALRLAQSFRGPAETT